MSIRAIAFLLLASVLFFAVASPSTAAEAPDEEAILGQVKKAVQSSDWKLAHKVTRQFLASQRKGEPARTSRIEWHHLESWLQTAANYPDDRPSQKKARAKAAEILGLYDLALEQYALQIKISREEDRNSPRSDAAFCAYRAAVHATAKADYNRAVRLFDLMHEYGSTWVKEAGKSKGEMVRKLVEQCKNVDFRLEFAQKFWVDNVPALGQHHDHARQFLIDTLDLKPNAAQKRQIYLGILSYSEHLGDIATSEQYVQRLAKEFAGDEAADQAAFSLSQLYFQKQQFENARDLLLALSKSGRQNRWVSLAQLGLAEVYAKLKDEPAMIRQLEMVANARPAPTERNLMDTSDTRQEAIQRLGRYYQDRGDFKKALAYYTRWQPRSWCGTCLMSMRQEREYHRVLCMLHLQDHAAAVRLILDAYIKDQTHAPFLGVLLFRLHREAGQMEDLLRTINSSKKLAGDEVIRDLVQIQNLAEKKDVASLIRISQDSGRVNAETYREPTQDWRCQAAAEALAACGEKAIGPVREAIVKGQQNVSWLIYALGRSSSTEALDVLREIARREKSWNCGNVAYALALKGEAGKKLLKELAEQDKNGMGAAAKDWLERMERKTSALSWPPPRSGSLPRGL